jgi:hypothetical protein
MGDDLGVAGVQVGGRFNKMSVILTLDDRFEAAMSKLVRKTLADSPMTPSRKRKLVQLAGQPDSEIDPCYFQAASSDTTSPRRLNGTGFIL